MFNIQQMMQKAQKMQKKMESLQEEMGGVEVQGAAGGGSVKVTMTCKGKMTALAIDPALIDLKAAFGATSFAVECDGPDHFIRCVDSHNSVLNGNTIFQTALMARRDPEQLLIRLPYDVFYQNMDNHEMWQYLMIALEEAGTGNYIVGPEGSLLSLTAGFDPGLPYEEHPVSPAAGPQ